MGETLENISTVLRGSRLVLRSPTQCDAGQLCELLHNDHDLRATTGMAGAPATPDEFLRYTADWCRVRSAISFTIVDIVSDQAIGLISLSHIDRAARSGRIGYWLASDRWRQGLTTEAFSLVLDLARQLELITVEADIEHKNIASWRIWVRQGVTLTPDHDAHYHCVIQL